MTRINQPGGGSESWEPIAKSIGYENEELMLKDLYLTRGMSLKQIAWALGYSYSNVHRRLVLMRVPMRSRGGPNNNRRILKDVSDDRLFNTSPIKLAEEFAIHISTVFKEKYQRERRPGYTRNHETATTNGVLSDLPSQVDPADAKVLRAEGTEAVKPHDPGTVPERPSVLENPTELPETGGSDNS